MEDNIFSALMLRDGQTLEIKGKSKEIIRNNTIPFMAHFMLEMQRQENSISTMQGAGVSLNNKAILLVGKRGSGKTSITLELCRKYNYSLIGNDLVLIGLNNNTGCLFGGTKIFSLRFSTVKYYNIDLQKYFDESKIKDEWTSRIDIYPKKLGISIEKNPVNIIKAFYVHLNNNPLASLYVRKIGDAETLYMGRLFLYEELSRYIRGVCIPIFGGSEFYLGNYLPSLDKSLYHNNRLNLINWLIENLGFYYISGSMDAICDFINQKLVKK